MAEKRDQEERHSAGDFPYSFRSPVQEKSNEAGGRLTEYLRQNPQMEDMLMECFVKATRRGPVAPPNERIFHLILGVLLSVGFKGISLVVALLYSARAKIPQEHQNAMEKRKENLENMEIKLANEKQNVESLKKMIEGTTTNDYRISGTEYTKMEMLRIKAKYNLKPFSDDLRHMRDVNDYLKQTAVKAIESASCQLFRGMSAIFVLALAAGFLYRWSPLMAAANTEDCQASDSQSNCVQNNTMTACLAVIGCFGVALILLCLRQVLNLRNNKKMLTECDEFQLSDQLFKTEAVLNALKQVVEEQIPEQQKHLVQLEEPTAESV